MTPGTFMELFTCFQHLAEKKYRQVSALRTR